MKVLGLFAWESGWCHESEWVGGRPVWTIGQDKSEKNFELQGVSQSRSSKWRAKQGGKRALQTWWKAGDLWVNMDGEEYFCSRGVTAYLETGMSPTESAVIPFHFILLYGYHQVSIPSFLAQNSLVLSFGEKQVFLLGLGMALCGRKPQYNEKFVYFSCKEFRRGPSRAGVLAARPSGIVASPVLRSAAPRECLSTSVPCGHCHRSQTCARGGRTGTLLFSDEASWKFPTSPPSSTSADLGMHLTHQYLETSEAVRPRLLVACKPSSWKSGFLILREKVRVCSHKETSTTVSAMETWNPAGRAGRPAGDRSWVSPAAGNTVMLSFAVFQILMNFIIQDISFILLPNLPEKYGAIGKLSS